jgi:hypothetical protein
MGGEAGVEGGTEGGGATNPMLAATESEGGEVEMRGTISSHASKDRALATQQTRNLERKTSVVAETDASERVSTAKAHRILRTFSVGSEIASEERK